MDALIAKADAIRPVTKKRRIQKDSNEKGSSSRPSTSDDRTLGSVSLHTALPKSLRTNSPPPENVPKYGHIKDKKLRTQLTRQSTQSARAKALVRDAELLLAEDAGLMEVEGEMEKTWRVGQEEIAQAAGQEAAHGRQEWKLDGGPYRSRYTRNGRCAAPVWSYANETDKECIRHLAIVGRKGHVATFDWQTGTMHAELQLQETCRDITSVRSHPRRLKLTPRAGSSMTIRISQ